MEYTIEILIYLIAIFGIIITSFSIFEMKYNNVCNNTYRIHSKESENGKDIEIKVIINGLSKEEEKDLVEKLKNDKIYLKDISNTITIENNNSCDK